MSSAQRFWTSRLRWRLRGAWQWPAFVALTLADALVMHLLPPVRTGVDPIPSLLLATFGNVFLIGALAPWLARRIRANRPVPPGGPPAETLREVVQDRVAVGLLAAGLVALVASGLATRPLVVAETEATEENARVVRDHVLRSGDEELMRNVETANTVRLREGYFRTCIARDDRRHYFCLFVDTNKEPTDVDKDPSSEPNSVYRPAP